jgi:glycosyltransferase involved in cell wall biosynthesis
VTEKLGVIVLAGPDNGGTYQYTLSMLQGLQHAKGFEITVYGDPNDAKLAELGYPIVRFAESYAWQLAALAAHRLKIRLLDPFRAEDVLLAPIYSLALLHTSRPFAYTLHDLQENYYPDNFSPWQRIWRRQVHAGLLLRTRRVVCESKHVKSDIVRSFGIAEDRIVVMQAPPQREFLTEPGAEKLQEVRSRLQLPNRFLFYPAQFWAHKNHLRLIEAFREIISEAPDLELVLTGKKRDEYHAVMDAVEKLGLNGRVRHLGYVERDDLQAIYRLATALVMPSLFESISIPIYEAFQVGTPVVASAVLAIPEQVGDAGVLFEPTSVASIRDAVLKITGDPAAASLLGKRGRDRMMQMTPERYGDQLQNLLSELR